jgi:pyruvate dehydrogenase E2 component (dihydrolipoyllysine-residue acetyltransferase)
MTTDVLMPQLGLEVTDATIVGILVAPGDALQKGTPMFELETDKATTEVVAPETGTVMSIEVLEGQVVSVGSILARIGSSAHGASHEPSADRTAAAEPVAAANGGRLRAAPVARRAAARLGIALETMSGTGPRGRITLRDVEREAIGRSIPPDPATARVTQTLSPLRRAIARRMAASQLIPQYRLERDIDATHILAEKDARAADGSGPRLGVNDLLLQAIAETVARHPVLGASYVEEPEPGLAYPDGINVGLAVATDRGLVVPVLRAVERSGLREIATERHRLVEAARAGRLSLEAMSGGSITLSSLAGFGVDRFTAMLNPGESAILAVGRTVDRVVPRGRDLTVVPTVTMTMTFDHRVVDGAVGAAALAEFAALVEGGMTWRP